MTGPSAAPAKPQRLPALPPASTLYRPNRKRIHLACFLVFMALPFTNFMRFDLPRQRFYFAGFELGISEFSIIFFAMMLLMFLVAASAIVYGRIYCSYACPQMIFSEWSVSLETWAGRQAQKHFPKRKSLVSKGLFYGILLLASVFLAFIFTSYFLAPRDLFQRLIHLDFITVGGITGATVTLFTFLDLTLVRQKFCTTVCPYGYLQGMLQDKHTLLVSYQDETNACIDCKKCVRVCEMGIDIRESPFQIECVHCGDCVDACEDVLRKVGHPGLIHYTWGDKLAKAGKEPFWWRLGIRDAKRVVLLALLLVYLAALGTALALRRNVLVTINADREVLFKVQPDGKVVNRIRFTFANRSSKPVEVKVWSTGLPGAELDLARVPLAPGATLERTVDLRVAPWPGAQDMNPFKIYAQCEGERTPDLAEMNFMMPVKGE